MWATKQLSFRCSSWVRAAGAHIPYVRRRGRRPPFGRNAACPLTRAAGIEVDAINSVQFSNHTGYPTFRGDRLDGAQLGALLEGLSANWLVAGAYRHLLTGYIGSLSFLTAVASVAGA